MRLLLAFLAGINIALIGFYARDWNTPKEPQCRYVLQTIYKGKVVAIDTTRGTLPDTLNVVTYQNQGADTLYTLITKMK